MLCSNTLKAGNTLKAATHPKLATHSKLQHIQSWQHTQSCNTPERQKRPPRCRLEWARYIFKAKSVEVRCALRWKQQREKQGRGHTPPRPIPLAILRFLSSCFAPFWPRVDFDFEQWFTRFSIFFGSSSLAVALVCFGCSAVEGDFLGDNTF
jgi:hypothetical protein